MSWESDMRRGWMETRGRRSSASLARVISENVVRVSTTFTFNHLSVISLTMPDTRPLSPLHDAGRPAKRSRVDPATPVLSSEFPDPAPLAKTYQDSEPYKHIAVEGLFPDSLVSLGNPSRSGRVMADSESLTA
jgi:hypothetical protein